MYKVWVEIFTAEGTRASYFKTRYQLS